MFIDPHIHMSSRTTDDYERMAASGIVAVIEPAFWNGQPRTSVETFRDYYNSLVGWERFRASQFGIAHYATIGLNSKEANDEQLAEEVLELIPFYLGKEGVVGVGEIGFDDITQAEEKAFRAQLELAVQWNLPVQIHTPHRDKRQGTLRSMDIIREHGLQPEDVVIDHNTEETVHDTLNRGYYAAFTLYPRTKMDEKRMIHILKQYGSERIIADSSADWGVSNPLAVPQLAGLMEEAGFAESDIKRVTYSNALKAFAPREGEFGGLRENEFIQTDGIDQRKTYAGNTVLRGQVPRVEQTNPTDNKKRPV